MKPLLKKLKVSSLSIGRLLTSDVVYDWGTLKEDVHNKIKDYSKCDSIDLETDVFNRQEYLRFHLETYKLHRQRFNLLTLFIVIVVILAVALYVFNILAIDITNFLFQYGLKNESLTNAKSNKILVYLWLLRFVLIAISLSIFLVLPLFLEDNSDQKSDHQIHEDESTSDSFFRIYLVTYAFLSIGLLALAIKIALNPLAYFSIRHDFIGGVEEIRQAIAFPLFFLIFLPVVLVIVSLINELRDFFLRAIIPDSYIVFKLIDVMLTLEKPNNLSKSRVRSSLINSINEVANCFQYNIPNQIKASNSYDRVVIDKEYKSIANGFRSLRAWLYSPKIDTKKHLFYRLKKNLNSFLDGAIDDLPRAEESLSIGITRKEVFINTSSRLINLVGRVSIPFLLLWLLNKIGLEISSEVKNYLFAGAFSLSSLILLIELDPNIGQKLDLLKQVRELLQSRK